MLHIPYFGDAVKLFKQKFIGDGVDRLISFASAMLCAISSGIIVGKQLMGSPMTCWVPTHIRGMSSQYVLDYCYIQNTYVVPKSEIDVSFDRTKYSRVNYYQWLALYFVLQALIFYLPSFLWRKWYKNSEIDITTIMKETKQLRNLDGEEKEAALKNMTMSVWLTVRERDHNEPRGLFKGIFHGGCSYLLTYKYLFMKLLNLTIVVVAISQISDYLDHTNFFWSVQALKALLSGTKWVDSTNFPRVTMCDLWVRQLGNVQNHTIQCLLGMNYVNEKLFFVEWIWLFIVLCCAAYNVMSFAYTVFMPASRIHRIQSWLNRPRHFHANGEEIMHFSDVIGLDGFLTLYFIECHSGSRAAADFGGYLFKELQEERQTMKHKKFSVAAMPKKWPSLFPKLSFCVSAPVLHELAGEDDSSVPGSPITMKIGSDLYKQPLV